MALTSKQKKLYTAIILSILSIIISAVVGGVVGSVTSHVGKWAESKNLKPIPTNISATIAPNSRDIASI
jgi:uncharacterized membrane protein YkvI